MRMTIIVCGPITFRLDVIPDIDPVLGREPGLVSSQSDHDGASSCMKEYK